MPDQDKPSQERIDSKALRAQERVLQSCYDALRAKGLCLADRASKLRSCSTGVISSPCGRRGAVHALFVRTIEPHAIRAELVGDTARAVPVKREAGIVSAAADR
jgi:hypothetical protein